MPTALFSAAPSPESVGVPSGALSSLLDAIEQNRMTMHSVMIVSRGRVAFEASWPYFDADKPHRMYSVSKSFVALAVGLMIGEGRLSLEDRVHAFFPDKVPEPLHPYLRDATVRDLLMMATPHTGQSYTVKDGDWAKTFFHAKPTHPAGTVFYYDTSGTVILCTIVERLSGMPFLDYLRPRLLDPIGFSKDVTCIKTPEGTSWGGSGVLCSLRDMAKVAYVCMHHGRWGDVQLLPQSFVDAATSKQIDNAMSGAPGYGYQIWRTQGNGFAFNGMGGQHAFCYPDKDLIVACTADRQCDTSRSAIAMDDLAFSLMEAAVQGEAPACKADREALKARTGSLSLPLIDGEANTPLAPEIDGRWFVFAEENPMGIVRARVVLNQGGGAFEYENARGAKRIAFGLRRYREDRFPEYYFDDRIGTIGTRRYRCLNTAAWVEPHKLYVRVCAADTYFGGLQITVSFKGDEMSLFMTKVAEWFFDAYQGMAGGRAEA